MGRGDQGLLVSPVPLAATAEALRTGQLDLLAYIEEICDRIERIDPLIQAFLPEDGRRERLIAEARALQARFPDPAGRPALYGIPVGVKDIFYVDGFPTRGGSQLPADVFVGREAECVTRLRAAGALIAGKTVSTEFAWAEPGPTRNPHNLDHTPGGSSSGSAAAVAAGLCPLALGTQTIGSVIRPAAFCGIVGFKPSYGRISTAGVIAFSESVDTIGYFTQNVAGTALVAPLLCQDWREVHPEGRPVLGVPHGPYLAQASKEALEAFEEQLARLQEGGYTVKRVPALSDIEAINHRHRRMIFAELAQVHSAWFAQYEPLYRPRTAAAIREGQTISAGELARAREGRSALRNELEMLMTQEGIDLWVCPAATGPAPEGLESTGDPIMNLPWTYAGMPVITLPAGHAGNGLPLGLQIVGKVMADEQVVQRAGGLEKALG